MRLSKKDQFKQGINTLIWNKLETKFIWKKLAFKTIVVPTTIGFIQLDQNIVTLFDKNGIEIGIGFLDIETDILVGSHYINLDEFEIDLFIYNLSKKFNFENLLNHVIWKADKIS